ncbi:MAG: hypothetical protein PHR78_02540 [Eubacteriales bacterium]|nr:hypothetical protein [Eubacteriales bacterium]MDD4541031.1 hypothetical protein [Eubacteriales bacterium]
MNAETSAPDYSAAVYRGQVESPLIGGNLEITIEAEGVRLSGILDSVFVAYDSVSSLSRQNHKIIIDSRVGPIELSRIGMEEESFYLNLCQAFNQKVQSVFQPEGSLLLEVKNSAYKYDGREGQAVLRVFDDCLLLLPPNLDARRIAFAFVSGIMVENYLLTLSLGAAEQYSFSRLGYDLDPLESGITDAILKLKSRNAELLQQLEPELSRDQAVQAARLLPEGVAVQLAQLRAAFPALAGTLEKKWSEVSLAEYSGALREICADDELAVGYKFVPAPEAEDSEEAEREEAEQKEVSSWALWTVMPSQDGQKAVLEFAFPDEKTATYVFDTKGDFKTFLRTLNRAFEASDFRRELLFLTDTQLEQAEYAAARMLLERTPSLQALRESFVGRVIHRSVENWCENLQALLR